MLTQEEANYYFTYDPLTGELYWKNPTASWVRPGANVGGHDRGYKRCKVNGKSYLVHRIIWLMVHGRWPTEIDHINGVGDDNRLQNLREVTRQQNMMNIRGWGKYPKGVSKKGHKFRAQIQVDGAKFCLGTYDTPEEASRVYEETAKEWFGKYRYVRK